MDNLNKLLSYLDDYSHPWTQMTSMNNPAVTSSVNLWQERILSELKYLHELSQFGLCDCQALLNETSDLLYGRMTTNGALTREDALEAEKRLSGFIDSAKGISVHCVSHAHIDMNWMWGWHETVSITIDTFRTMLNLMEEFSDFTYSQSQGSTYRIIEQYAPEMIDEIKTRVHEGRWELSASTWVENDKNMSGTESMARHILYTKDYLSRLFDVAPETIRIDFEPDTFGHSSHLPEILQRGGVEYYYHCRGNDTHVLYNWQAPSGKQILVFRDPIWYGNSIHPNIVMHIPKICSDHGINQMLAVYGVGDHGGGPSRRDIEKLREMQEWPLFPTLKFSSYHAFFDAVAPFRDNFPVVKGEQNFVLTGCLTSSSRIKMANRYGEGALYEAEFASSASALLLNTPYDNKRMAELWKDVLFNQFHDILPGCGMVFTREYALGKFQDVLAGANSLTKAQFEKISDSIDLEGIPLDMNSAGETADGAGVGVLPTRLDGDNGLSFNIRHSHNGRGKGTTRVYHLFNTSQYSRKEGVTIMVWDYRGDHERIGLYGSDHKALPFALTKQGFNQHWGHFYTELLLEADIPALGYETVYIKEEAAEKKSVVKYSHSDPRVNRYKEYVLENDYIKALYDEKTMELISLYDKESKKTVFSSEESRAGFNYRMENGKEASAWVVGEILSENSVFREISKRVCHENKVRQSITYTLKLASSELQIAMHLDRFDRGVTYHVRALWNEIGTVKSIPQLNFSVPVNNTRIIYDVPGGMTERGPLHEDVGGLSFGISLQEKNRGLYIANESKYGYRAEEDFFSLSLLRSTQNPDTHPETGTHFFDFQLGYGTVLDAEKAGSLMNRTVTAVNSRGSNSKGKKKFLPLRRSVFTLEGNSMLLSSIKMAEDGSGDGIIRINSTSSQTEKAVLTCPFTVKEVEYTDINEGTLDLPSLEKNGSYISLEALPYSLISLRIKRI